MLSLHEAASPGETRVVLLQGDEALEYYIHRPADPDGFGALHWGRVVARVPAMAGVFLSIAGAEAFLPDTEGGAGLHDGDGLVVRVTRAAMGDKGPRVSARLPEAESALGGAGPVRMLQPGPSPLAELQAAYPEAALTRGAFPPKLAASLAALEERSVDLPGGMRASIVPTPALTAIDMDSAAATAARGSKAALQFAANRQALPALARQLRLRNLSGAILVDFCGMPARKRAALAPALTHSLAMDRLAPRLAGFTALGFAEILRPRWRPPLHERLAGPHAAGLAALRAVAAEARVAPGGRFTLWAAPAVCTALADDTAACADLSRAMPYPLILRADPVLPANSWRVVAGHG